MIKIFLSIILLTTSLSVLAVTKKQPLNDTIPFVTYYSTACYSAMSHHGDNCVNPSITHVPVSELKTTIEQVKKGVCSTVGDADVKIWLIVSAEGKVGIASFEGGVFGQSGIEVTFRCKANDR